MAFTYITWLIPRGLMVLVLIAMIRRKMWTEFPFFFSYLIFMTVRTIVLVIVYRALVAHRTPYATYFWSFCVAQALEVIAKFFIIYEIFVYALKPYSSLSRLIRILFVWSFLVLLVVAFITAAAFPVNDRSPLLQTIFTLERTMGAIQIGLLAFLFLFIKVFAIPWKHYLFGIALGLALYGTFEFAAIAIRIWGPAFYDLSNWITRIDDGVGAVVWVVYFVLPQNERVPLETKPVSPLREWNAALREILSNAGVISS
ncbi:MAG TPA: hypothetical protein VF493_20695 [Terriglobales bacterium]